MEAILFYIEWIEGSKMQTKTIAMGVAFLLAGISGIDSYQQRGNVSELRKQVGLLENQLNKGQEAHFSGTDGNVLTPSKENKGVTAISTVATNEKVNCESNYRDQVLSTYTSLDVSGRARVLRELISLARNGDIDAKNAVFAALNDKDPKVRRVAVKGMRRLKAVEQLPMLDHLIHDPDPRVRLTVLETIADLSDSPTEAGSVVSTFLNDTNEEVVSQALRRISTLNYKEALPRVNQLLESENINVVAKAAATARSLGDDAAADSVLPRIANGLESVKTHDRLMALKSLSDVGGEASIEYFQWALKDSDTEVREIAQVYLDNAQDMLKFK